MKSKLLFCIFFMGFFAAFAQNNRTEAKPKPAESHSVSNELNHYQSNKITYKIIDAANHTFCYDIFIDGKLMIHMPSITGTPGDEGFKTKEEAEKTAKLIVKKIKNGELISGG